MEVATIKVESRVAKGTKNVRNLRDSGKIPMVLYGGKTDPLDLQANYHEIKRHLEHHLRVFKLQMGDKTQPSYLQDVQWDCLTDEPMHIDFRRIDMDTPLKMDIELVLLGYPKGLSAGGRLIRDSQNLQLSCLPAHVPEQIEVRISEMELGEKLFARDIELPEGCTLDMSPDQLLVHVSEI